MAYINELLKFCGTPKNITFVNLTNKIGLILIRSYQAAIVVLAVVIFFFNLTVKGKEVSAPDP